jgi:hypothetical protein
MRPRSETREALAGAAERLAMVHGYCTRHAMAQAAGVALDAAKQTVRDMRRAGELVPCGLEALPHARRPAVRYVPRHLQHEPAIGLQAVTHSWVRSGG